MILGSIQPKVPKEWQRLTDVSMFMYRLFKYDNRKGHKSSPCQLPLKFLFMYWSVKVL